ncbi:methyltransferase domain-containing protein [Methylotuvimicrobium sp. KM2]|uniref:class I SAM-dependent methyltransferase n=1 Tax=Methylotuvimicrobium sp. KM2 TaxID=3133976 RepID=UPI00310131D5
MCNIACGENYIKDWINFDYSPNSKYVRKADLLKPLPVADSFADLVYSSNFIEHIPRNLVRSFLNECFRIIKSGGYLRLVLPDWEELCSTYLTLRRSDEQQQKRADFLMLEMLDQCVRTISGGELGAYYQRLQAKPSEYDELIEFVQHLTGHKLRTVDDTVPPKALHRSPFKRILSKLEQQYIRAVISLLPSAFRHQNISWTQIGEKHAWMYDFYTIGCLLSKAGFVDVQRMSATTSNISDFPFMPLDVNPDGSPRKGAESMYIEAVKP